MHKLNAWAEGSWDTNGDHLFFTKPKANWTQKGPHSGIKNMGREKAYARLYKRVHVSPHLSAEMQYWPEQKKPPRSLWKCSFFCNPTLLSLSSPLPKQGKLQKREKENDAGFASLFADLAIEPSKLSTGNPYCLAFTHKVVNTKTKWKGGVQTLLMAFTKPGPRARGHRQPMQEHILIAWVAMLRLMHDSPKKPQIRKKLGDTIKGSLKRHGNIIKQRSKIWQS